MDQSYVFELVTDPDRLEGHYGEIARLINQLLGRETEEADAILFLASPAAKRNMKNVLTHSRFFILSSCPPDQPDSIVGMATLIDVYKPTRYEGLIEDIIIEQSHRGKKLGEDFLAHIVTYAKQFGMMSLSRTRNPENPNCQHAIYLYEKLGFEE